MKIILIILGAVLAVFLLTPAFIDADATVSRSIDVNKPASTVYTIVKDFNYYKQWNAWSQMDKKATGEISGPVGEIGATWSWEGDTVGKGSLTIEELEPNKAIKSRLVFWSPMEGEAQDLWDFEMLDSTTTKITWTYAGTASSYFARLGNLAIEGILGPDLEKGLSNLKELIEKMPATEEKSIE